MSKQLTDKIDQRLSWNALLFMAVIVGYGVKSMKPSRVKKMFIQNGCFAGIILLIVVTLIKLKKQNILNNSKKIPLLEIEERVE